MIYVTKLVFKLTLLRGSSQEMSCLAFLIKSWTPHYLLCLHITSIAL